MSEFSFLNFIGKTPVFFHAIDNFTTWEDVIKRVGSFLEQNFGIWGSVLFFILIIIFYVWKNWKDFKERPGVSWVISKVLKKTFTKGKDC